mgnify:CR=1 FL=1
MLDSIGKNIAVKKEDPVPISKKKMIFKRRGSTKFTNIPKIVKQEPENIKIEAKQE